MHGDSDRLTSVTASREFARRAPSSCTLRIWPGLTHELHHEPEKAAVFAEISNWLEALPSAQGPATGSASAQQPI
jgi:alpha-beta hydrolase superfamily lysophospholipase